MSVPPITIVLAMVRFGLEPLGLTVQAAAEGLGVSRQALSNLINGRAGVSAEMALRLEKAGWSTAETWVGLQASFDLWEAKKRTRRLKVTRFRAPEPA